ncbi:MAG TPA: alkyl sulfatase C-terminal domain-containing protein [Candidatus Eisenbacteria bacterium]|nr:alkyl sulfatase C-terminal domain-containing protein [Candidatus Eisenbacteria bacterium]
MAGQATMDDQIANGKARLAGDRKPYEQLKGILVRFTPDFEIMPGTKAPEPGIPQATNPFEVERPAVDSVTD